jgi:hypothetical protein
MGLLSRRNSPIADAEREVSALRAKRDELATKLAQAEAAVEQARADRRTRLVEGDDPDDAPDHVATARERRDSLIDAIAEVDQRLSAAVQKLGELRDKTEREQKAAKHRRQIAEAREALPEWIAQTERLIAKLQPLETLAFEAAAAAGNVKYFKDQLVVAIEVGLTHVESYIAQMLAGAPIKHEPMPIEPPPPKPPAIERQSVFLRHASFWYENGEVVTSGPHTTPALPVEVAQQALSHNHAVPVDSQAAADLRAQMDPAYGFWPADRCIDLTKPRPAPPPPGEPATATALPVHSEFTPRRRPPMIGTAIAR